MIENKILSYEEEQQLASKIQQGSQEAINKLIEHNLRLVKKIAHDFYNYSVPIEDLISEGNKGLIRAAEKFKPDMGSKFSSYASWWIKQYMRRMICKEKLIKIPLTHQNNLNQINSAERELSSILNREPTNKEISDYTNIKEQKVNYIRLASGDVLSIYNNVAEGSGKIADLIPVNSSASDEIDRKHVQRLIYQFIKELDDREKYIIRQRFGLNHNKRKTLVEVSKKLNITHERVRQIENDSLRKLKKKIHQEISEVSLSDESNEYYQLNI